jgi:hypothetical protein
MRYKKVGGIRFVQVGRFGFSFWVSRARPRVSTLEGFFISCPSPNMPRLLPKADEFDDFVIKPELEADLEGRLKSGPKDWDVIEA